MAKFRATNDYLTIIGTSNFTHTNVTDLTADPDIRKESDAAQDGFATNGVILILDEEMGQPQLMGDFRHDRYFLKIRVEYNVNAASPSAYADQITAEMVAELDRLHIANNDDLSKSYIYNIVDMDTKSTSGDLVCTRELTVEAIHIFQGN